LFDSHCHPTDIENPIDVVDEAIRAGLHSLLACGYNAESNGRVEGLRASVPGLPVAIGVHPWYASEALDSLHDRVLRSRAVAIGECGLDWAEKPPMPARDVQLRAFEFQLDLARQLHLPVTVHSRQAIDSVKDVVKGFTQVRGILHAFGGSYEQAKPFIEQGWLIGIGAAVTRPQAKRVRKLATQLPLSSLAIETDAPAIGMEGIRVPHVRPAHLTFVVKAISELRAISQADVAVATSANVDELFGSNVTSPLVRLTAS
jgi:TatD DNase family protein